MDPITMGAVTQGAQSAQQGITDAINMGIQIWALKQQQKQAATENTVKGSQYNQEYADKRADTDYLKGRDKKSDILAAKATEKEDSQNAFSNIIASFNTLPNQMRNNLVQTWQSKTGRVA